MSLAGDGRTGDRFVLGIGDSRNGTSPAGQVRQSKIKSNVRLVTRWDQSLRWLSCFEAVGPQLYDTRRLYKGPPKGCTLNSEKFFITLLHSLADVAFTYGFTIG